MNAKHIREIQTNEVLRKRLAKYIALHCFRNTDVLEDLHSGEVPVSESGDCSDVKVITPDREIPWSDLSRFDNSEMKAMMIDVVNHCDQFFATLFSTPGGDKLIEELGRRDRIARLSTASSAECLIAFLPMRSASCRPMLQSLLDFECEHPEIPSDAVRLPPAVPVEQTYTQAIRPVENPGRLWANQGFGSPGMRYALSTGRGLVTPCSATTSRSTRGA